MRGPCAPLLLPLVLGASLAGCGSRSTTETHLDAAVPGPRDASAAETTDITSDAPLAQDRIDDSRVGQDRVEDAPPQQDRTCPSAAVADLFQTVFVAGASDSPGCGHNPCSLADLEPLSVYFARVIVAAAQCLGGCIDWTPVSWDVGYTNPESAPATTTLSMAMDAFFHFTGQDPASFQQSVEGYLAALHTRVPSVPLFVANVPASLMIDPSQAAERNSIIAAAIAVYPGYHLIDLDWYFGKLVAGKVEYEGVVLTFEAIGGQIHVNALGHQVVADLFINALNAAYPELGLPNLGTLVVQD